MGFEKNSGFETPHSEGDESLRTTLQKEEEKRGFMQRLAEKKKAVMAATVASVVAVGASEASAGARGEALFDELDSVMETTQKAPAVHQEKHSLGKKEGKRMDAFEMLDRVEELVRAYKDAKTDGERDRYATQIAETLITGGEYTRLEENTIHTFTSTFLNTPIEVRYIVLGGIARGSLTDKMGNILHKGHEFQFPVQ